MAGAERDNIEIRRGRMRMSMHVMTQSGVTSCDRDANYQLRVALGRLVVPSFLFATGIQTQTSDISDYSRRAS